MIGGAMGRMRPTRDIQPITEFRANAAQLIGRVRETGEPMYLTQHGKSAAVLLDVEAYEALIDQIELLKDIRIADAEIDAGKGIPHAKVAKQLRAQLKRSTR
jgi:antitoxin YefM